MVRECAGLRGDDEWAKVRTALKNEGDDSELPDDLRKMVSRLKRTDWAVVDDKVYYKNKEWPSSERAKEIVSEMATAYHQENPKGGVCKLHKQVRKRCWGTRDMCTDALQECKRIRMGAFETDPREDGGEYTHTEPPTSFVTYASEHDSVTGLDNVTNHLSQLTTEAAVETAVQNMQQLQSVEPIQEQHPIDIDNGVTDVVAVDSESLVIQRQVKAVNVSLDDVVGVLPVQGECYPDTEQCIGTNIPTDVGEDIANSGIISKNVIAVQVSVKSKYETVEYGKSIHEDSYLNTELLPITVKDVTYLPDIQRELTNDKDTDSTSHEEGRVELPQYKAGKLAINYLRNPVDIRGQTENAANCHFSRPLNTIDIEHAREPKEELSQDAQDVIPSLDTLTEESCWIGFSPVEIDNMIEAVEKEPPVLDPWPGDKNIDVDL